MRIVLLVLVLALLITPAIFSLDSAAEAGFGRRNSTPPCCPPHTPPPANPNLPPVYDVPVAPPPPVAPAPEPTPSSSNLPKPAASPILLASATAAVPVASEIPSEMTDYVFKPDASFSWKLAAKDGKKEKLLGTVYTLDFVSQTWHDIKWDHQLLVFVPKGVKPQATMVLWIEGDAPNHDSSEDMGLVLAAQIKAPVAFLFNVPRQPLYGGKTEDALMAESFVRYLVTEDSSWPLLFPMVKSAIRAMDALQEFARAEWKFEVKDFVVAGASKRGWTAWLTAGTGDKRVKAVAPLVIDTVNIPVQMQNQLKAFGRPSDMIKDYAERQLLPIPKTAPAARLWKIIDPWTYRDRLTMPKMIVNGTNDPYWPLDALNTYWDGLKGDKWVLYVPNAGHYLCEKDAKGIEDKLPTRTIATLSAFCRAQIYDKPFPKIDSMFTELPDAQGLDVKLLCDVKPIKASIYSASSSTRDFRQSFWTAKPVTLDGKKTECRVDLPKTGDSAAFVELEFTLDDMTYKLSSPLRILEATKK